MHEKKMPWLAGLFSVIPGLGQLYNGQISKALAICGLLILSGILCVFSLVGPELFGPSNFFWVGNDPRLQRFLTIFIFVFVVLPLILIYSIVDAVLSAQRINDLAAAHAGKTNQGVSVMNDMNQNQFNEPNQATQPNPQNPTGQTWSSPQGENAFAQNTTQNTTAPSASARNAKRGRLFWAILFLGVGFMGMLQFLDVDLSITWHRLWPLIPLALGIKLLADYHAQGETGQMILGSFFTLVGVLFLLNNWGFHWPWHLVEDLWRGAIHLIERFWWLAMMVIGSVMLISYYHSKRS